MVDLRNNILIIILKLNGLNVLIKIEIGRVDKDYLNLCFLLEIEVKFNGIDRLKVREWKIIYYVKINKIKIGYLIK